MKTVPIKERILKAYRANMGYWELLNAVFPEDQFPKARRRPSHGGPMGCAMAFGKAIRELGGHVKWTDANRPVFIPWQ